MALVKRSTKGSPLTHAEMDANLEHLDSKLGTNGTNGTNGTDGAPGADGESVDVFVDGAPQGRLERIDLNVDLKEATFVHNGQSFVVSIK